MLILLFFYSSGIKLSNNIESFIYSGCYFCITEISFSHSLRHRLLCLNFRYIRSFVCLYFIIKLLSSGLYMVEECVLIFIYRFVKEITLCAIEGHCYLCWYGWDIDWRGIFRKINSKVHLIDKKSARNLKTILRVMLGLINERRSCTHFQDSRLSC